MPRFLTRSLTAPILLVVFTIAFSIGIIAVRLTVHPYAGRIWAPIMFSLFALAHYLTHRREKRIVQERERNRDG